MRTQEMSEPAEARFESPTRVALYISADEEIRADVRRGLIAAFIERPELEIAATDPDYKLRVLATLLENLQGEAIGVCLSVLSLQGPGGPENLRSAFFVEGEPSPNVLYGQLDRVRQHWMQVGAPAALPQLCTAAVSQFAKGIAPGPRAGRQLPALSNIVPLDFVGCGLLTAAN